MIGPRSWFFSSSTTERQRDTNWCPVARITDDEGSLEYWSKTGKYGLQTWNKRGVILEDYSFETSYTLIKRLLQQLATPILAWVGRRKTMLGPPASGTSRLVTTARLLRTTLSLSTPVDTSPVPSPPVSSSVPTMQETIMNIRWKHYHDN